jgi:D-alanyl-D-alanine carboxypeptidase/D-alanyl-D-alanine-endopeptidase (penicillin-binding protein 4)
VASVSSAPLREIVGELLRTSDNNTAELLTKELGVAAGTGGTTAAGLAVIDATLQSWGVPAGSVTLTDGSGLDRGNRMSCDALLAVLQRHATGDPVIEGLAVAGETGTLADDFGGSAMAGRLRGKTGSLTGVRALVGVLPGVDAPDVSFAMILNTPDAANTFAGYWRRLGAALATFPSRPDLAAFGPQPAVSG